jgi:hypothetical protein
VLREIAPGITRIIAFSQWNTLNDQRLYAILQRGHKLYDSKLGDVRWERALKEFRERVEELNQRIRLYNLKAPATAVHRKVIDADSLIIDLEKEQSKK